VESPKVDEIERKFLASIGRNEMKSKVELFYDNIY
jgi:hypothetical protein